MLKSKANGKNGIEKLSRKQIIDILEINSRRRLGIGAKQLFQNYRNGKLEDPCEVADLIGLSRLLPKDDPLFV